LSTTSPEFKAVRRNAITTEAPDKHPVDGIPESADGSSFTLITIQKIDERFKEREKLPQTETAEE
jgi:hypothetical protein